MKRVLLSSVVAMSATGAIAADLPLPMVEEQIVEAPFSWSGFYIGAHGGYALAEKDLAWVEFIPGPIDPPSLLSQDLDGVIAGGHVGANLQFGNFIVGAEAAASWADLEETDDCPFPNGGGECTSEVEWFGTAGPHVGIAWDRVMLRIKGGVAWASDEYSVRFDAIPAGNEDGSQDRVGFMVGGGLAVALGRNWSISADYEYLDFGEEDLTLRFVDSGDFDERVEVDQIMHVGRIGVSYRFNGLN
jgi:outer membrane immunogenic protein